MSYAGVHSRSYGLVGRKGSSVTFTKQDVTYTESTDVSSVSSSTIAGVAVEDIGSGKSFQSGSLTEQRGITLYFVPATLGDEPEEGATCSWGGVSYTVVKVKSVSPDGTPIGSYVELA